MFWTKRVIVVTASIAVAVGIPGTALDAQVADLRARIIEHSFQFLPPGPGPFPTIVAIPGCSGIAFPDRSTEASHPALGEDDRLFRAHYPRTADQLRNEGFAVLLIHLHGAEGLVTACRGEIPAERIASYIDEALAWASDLDFVDRRRLHLIGWSMGGMGVLEWLQGERRHSEDVRSAIAVYPACANREPLTNRTPLLMLLGGGDDIAEPSQCQDLIARSSALSAVSVITYPGARHGYDIVDAPAVLQIGNDMTIGYQKAAADAAWREILAFVQRGH